MTALTVSEVLERAADVIARNGWYPDWFYKESDDMAPEDCPVNALGAMSIAATGWANPTVVVPGQMLTMYRLATETFARHVWPELKDELARWDDVEAWEQEKGRTQAEVVAALRAAAEEVRRG